MKRLVLSYRPSRERYLLAIVFTCYSMQNDKSITNDHDVLHSSHNKFVGLRTAQQSHLSVRLFSTVAARFMPGPQFDVYYANNGEQLGSNA